MPRARVLYTVYNQRGTGSNLETDDWRKACGAAVAGSMNEETAYVIDVRPQNVEGAHRFGGDVGARRFAELGDKTRVFERIEIRADSVGVPS